MNRREMIALAAATATRAIASPRFDPERVRVRKTGKVQIVFDSPVPAPTGLQATQDRLVDHRPGRRQQSLPGELRDRESAALVRNRDGPAERDHVLRTSSAPV
jgi:hypothetical protein